VEDEKLTDQMIMITLDGIYSRLLSLEEKINCIQHTVCQNDDKKTIASIQKFLTSKFRNTGGH
jgi:hypothetical protein